MLKSVISGSSSALFALSLYSGRREVERRQTERNFQVPETYASHLCSTAVSSS